MFTAHKSFNSFFYFSATSDLFSNNHLFGVVGKLVMQQPFILGELVYNQSPKVVEKIFVEFFL